MKQSGAGKTRLENLRHALLELHQALLQYSQRQFEGKHGRVVSKGKLFELVTGHPAFMWLRPLSELIVSLDELLEQKKPLHSAGNIKDLFRYTQRMLKVSPAGSKFEREYYRALQADPAVALAHAKTRTLAAN